MTYLLSTRKFCACPVRLSFVTFRRAPTVDWAVRTKRKLMKRGCIVLNKRRASFVLAWRRSILSCVAGTLTTAAPRFDVALQRAEEGDQRVPLDRAEADLEEVVVEADD